VWAVEWGNESREPEMINRLAEEKRKPALAHVRRTTTGRVRFMILKTICARWGAKIQILLDKR